MAKGKLECALKRGTRAAARFPLAAKCIKFRARRDPRAQPHERIAIDAIDIHIEKTIENYFFLCVCVCMHIFIILFK